MHEVESFDSANDNTKWRTLINSHQGNAQVSSFFLFQTSKWGYSGQLRYLLSADEVDASVGFALPINFPR